MRETLRVISTRQAGLADHVWEIEELVAMLEEKEPEAVEAGALKRGSYKRQG